MSLFESTATAIININHEITYASPPNAQNEDDNKVEGRATLEAIVAIMNITKPIVTGNGIYFTPVAVPVVVIIVVLSDTQFWPLVSATNGEVHAVTHIPFYCRGIDEGQGLVHYVVPLLYTAR